MLLFVQRTGITDIGLITASDFASITADLGIEEIVANYVSGLDPVKFAVANKIPTANLIAQDFEIMKAARFEQLITKVNANITLFRSTIAEQLIGGLDRKTLAGNLKLIQQGKLGAGIGLKPITDAQLNTAVHTATANFNRVVTAKAFEDKPEQRFEYVGGVIPTSSDTCRWLMNNQDPEGYTRDEIDAGIQTDDGVVNWFGRDPNFNCIHQWLPNEGKFSLDKGKDISPEDVNSPQDLADFLGFEDTYRKTQSSVYYNVKDTQIRISDHAPNLSRLDPEENKNIVLLFTEKANISDRVLDGLEDKLSERGFENILVDKFTVKFADATKRLLKRNVI